MKMNSIKEAFCTLLVVAVIGVAGYAVTFGFLAEKTYELTTEVADKQPSVIMVTFNKSPYTPEVATYAIGSCSATHIGHGLFITAGHCVDRSDNKVSFFADAKEDIKSDADELLKCMNIGVLCDIPAYEPSQLLWYNTKYDVALYLDRKAAEGRASANLDCREPLVNEEVTHIGFPAGVYFQSWGRISTTAVKRGNYWAKAQLVNLTGAPGSSGGSIFDDDGDLVGILNGGPSPWGGASVIVPGSVICGLMGRTPDVL